MPDVNDDPARYFTVDGRRWRATDPNVPDRLRQELVAELMDARRAVRASKSNPIALAEVRARVQHAKVALGERGEPWWEPPTSDGRATRARAAALALLNKRGQQSSICPSEVARIVASPDWRSEMGAIRAEMEAMVRDGLVTMTQGERTVDDPALVRGPVRLRLAQTKL